MTCPRPLAARVRVAAPHEFDFALIARRVLESNVGVGGIRVQVGVRTDGDQLVFPAGGQSVRLAAGWDAPAGPSLRLRPEPAAQ